MERHSKICVKVFQTKRKKFDVAEQRKATDATGKGIAETRPFKAKPMPETTTKKKPVPKWKLQSM